MHIGLIVSNAPHLKTEQTVFSLVEKGYTEITIISVPFKPRKPRNPLFQHRPDQSKSVPLDQLCGGLGLVFQPVANLVEVIFKNIDAFLMTGGILVPKEFIEKNGPILNCHPGLIPQSRGLDAFKWSILKGEEVGNTLHIIDENVDMGLVLQRRSTQVFADDTLEDFARRHYEAEIRLITDFDKFPLGEGLHPKSLGPTGKPHLRMNNEQELIMFRAFENYKAKFCTSERQK